LQVVARTPPLIGINVELFAHLWAIYSGKLAKSGFYPAIAIMIEVTPSRTSSLKTKLLYSIRPLLNLKRKYNLKKLWASKVGFRATGEEKINHRARSVVISIWTRKRQNSMLAFKGCASLLRSLRILALIFSVSNAR
jgi:hypothetical protein